MLFLSPAFWVSWAYSLRILVCVEVGLLAQADAFKMAELRLEPMPGCLQRLCLSLSFWIAYQNENILPLELPSIVPGFSYSLLINPVLPIASETTRYPFPMTTTPWISLPSNLRKSEAGDWLEITLWLFSSSYEGSLFVLKQHNMAIRQGTWEPANLSLNSCSAYCVNLSKFLNLSVPPCPPTYFKELLWEINEFLGRSPDTHQVLPMVNQYSK